MIKSHLSACVCMLLCSVYVYGQDWTKLQPSNGVSVPCTSFVESSDKELDNFLRIKGSSYSDMYVKLIKSNTSEVIREVYIKAGTSYHIRNIPQEKYFVKIAYGKEPEYNEQCQFRFKKEAGFERPPHEFNYFNRLATRGLVLPCYELNLRRSEQEEVNLVQASSPDIGFN